jgi:hypothetical protein
MTPEEFFEQMKMVSDRCGDDKEDSHKCMDRLMCLVLRELGYEKGVEFFENAPKWYA